MWYVVCVYVICINVCMKRSSSPSGDATGPQSEVPTPRTVHVRNAAPSTFHVRLQAPDPEVGTRALVVARRLIAGLIVARRLRTVCRRVRCADCRPCAEGPVAVARRLRTVCRRVRCADCRPCAEGPVNERSTPPHCTLNPTIQPPTFNFLYAHCPPPTLSPLPTPNTTTFPTSCTPTNGGAGTPLSDQWMKVLKMPYTFSLWPSAAAWAQGL